MKTIKVSILQEGKKIKDYLLDFFIKYCPGLEIDFSLNELNDLANLPELEIPNIIFINPYRSELSTLLELKEKIKTSVIILLLEKNRGWNFPLNHFYPFSYVYKPINEELLVITIENSKHFFALKKSEVKVKNIDTIGIPTTDGLDFIAISTIIRCESLNNYTKIILKKPLKAIISSYNLGEFKRLLIPYGFFCPHKSHLINLSFVAKYKREGIIFMKEEKNIIIPVARNKRNDFLKLITRL